MKFIIYFLIKFFLILVVNSCCNCYSLLATRYSLLATCYFRLLSTTLIFAKKNLWKSKKLFLLMDWNLWNKISQLTDIYEKIDKNLSLIQNSLENKENITPKQKIALRKLLFKTKKKFLLKCDQFVEHYILTQANVSYILDTIISLKLEFKQLNEVTKK